MAKNRGAQGAKMNSLHFVEQCTQAVADEMQLELVEVTLQKESRGKCLCVYVCLRICSNKNTEILW